MDKKQLDSEAQPTRRPYTAPHMMVMDEKEVLKVFQITSAGISWWG